MKVLYVEDELTHNVSAVIKVFGALLQKSQITDLEELRRREFDPVADEVKQILERAGVIDVEYTFPGAVRRLNEGTREYELLVVDRQLSKDGEYDLAAVQAIDPGFDEGKRVTYVEKEGDYLLSLVNRKNREWAKRFYFFTAYGHNDPLRSMPELQGAVDQGFFTKEQFVDKAVPEDVQRLADVVSQCEGALLWLRLSPYLYGIESLLKHRFIKNDVVPFLESDEGSIDQARPILEATVKALCRRIGKKRWVLDSLQGREELKRETFRGLVRAISETCVQCSGRGQFRACKDATSHDQEIRGLFRKVEQSAAICVYDTLSMYSHHAEERRVEEKEWAEVNAMVKGALKIILLRLSWLRKEGLI